MNKYAGHIGWTLALGLSYAAVPVATGGGIPLAALAFLCMLAGWTAKRDDPTS